MQRSTSLDSSSSSSSMDAVQRPSARGSSISVGPTNFMTAEESYFHDNNNYEIEKIWLLHLTTTPTIFALFRDSLEKILNILDRMENCILAANSSANNIPGVDSPQGENVSDKLEKKKKGLLCSNYTMADKLFVICGGIFFSLLAYLFAEKDQGQFNDTWMQVVFIGSFFAAVSSYILSVRASYLKESESVDGFDLGIFKGMLLLVLVYLNTVFCILLRVFANTPDWVLWTLGSIGSCSIVLGWVWFFYIKWPKIMEEMNAGHAGDGMPESPDPNLQPQV